MISRAAILELQDALPELPATVRRLRLKLGLSLRSAAAGMGIKMATLQRVEKGDGLPRIGTLLLILKWVAEQESP